MTNMGDSILIIKKGETWKKADLKQKNEFVYISCLILILLFGKKQYNGVRKGRNLR